MNFLPQKEKKKVEPYSKLASIYDDVMFHVNYKKWANYIHKIIREWHPQCNSILDISCGTGSFLLSLKSKGIERVGFDFSFDMVKVANQKIKSSTQKISFYQGDMIFFYLKRKFNVVVCLYDSINYLIDFNIWEQLFDRVSNVLSEKGLFVFDICTEKNSVKYFNNYSEKHGGIDYEYLRESSYDRKMHIHENKFTISFGKESNEYVEIHRQKIFYLKEILEFIRSTNFLLLGYFDGFSFKRASEESLRIHFVLRKK